VFTKQGNDLNTASDLSLMPNSMRVLLWKKLPELSKLLSFILLLHG